MKWRQDGAAFRATYAGLELIVFSESEGCWEWGMVDTTWASTSACNWHATPQMAMRGASLAMRKLAARFVLAREKEKGRR